MLHMLCSLLIITNPENTFQTTSHLINDTTCTSMKELYAQMITTVFSEHSRNYFVYIRINTGICFL